MKKDKLLTGEIKKVIILFVFILAFSISIELVLAVECGSIPTNNCDVTQNTTFEQGTYNLPNGINLLTNNKVLDCNNSVLKGNRDSSTIGIEIKGDYDNNIIKNCKILNYTEGITLESVSTPKPEFNILVNNTLGNNSRGIVLRHDVKYNTITQNIFSNNTIGIYLTLTNPSVSPRFNNISHNIIQNSSDSDIYLENRRASDSNNIWNNTINTRIFYTYTTNNNYVVGGLENIYIGNATGPTSEGLFIYNGLGINTNKAYIPGTYVLPNGIYIESSDITFNCNNSVVLQGTGLSGSKGIEILQLDYDYNTISNCEIFNYYYGIYVDASSSPVNPDFNLIFNNTIRNNTRGVQFAHNTESNTVIQNIISNNTIGIYFYFVNPSLTPNKNNITQNILQNNNDFGIYILGHNTTAEGINSNNIWKNNFIDNNAFDSGSNNSWNVSGQGNYWSEYDSESEGCFDTNSDLICDTPYNISGSANAKDYLPLLGIQILNIIPIQVIKDVDLVKDKTTLVRSILKNVGIVNRNINVSLYFDGILKNSTNNTINTGQEKNIDLFFIPDAAGSNKEIKIDVKEI